MNNFEQNVNFDEDLMKIAHKLELIAENRLPMSPIERDLTLQLLRDAYIAVLQHADTPAHTSEPAPAPMAEPEPVREIKPEPKPEPAPVRVEEPTPAPKPEPEVKVVVPEPVREVKPKPQPAPVAKPQPVIEPEPARIAEPEAVKVVEPEAAPEPAPEPIPDIISFLDVTEPDPEPVRMAEPEPKPQPAPAPKPAPASEPVHMAEPHPAPAPQPEPQLFSEEPAPQPKRSLNDLLGQEDNSLASKFQHGHIDDISKAISLNDKFLYIKELFKGKGEDFGKAIQKLNMCENIDEAFQTIDMLKKYYAWDIDSSAYLSLCDLVRRKFV